MADEERIINLDEIERKRVEKLKLKPLTESARPSYDPSLSYAVEDACDTMWKMVADTIIIDFTLMGMGAHGKAAEIGAFLASEPARLRLVSMCKNAVLEELEAATNPQYSIDCQQSLNGLFKKYE
ncbi:MAG: hypothetical protein ACYDG3_13415 [Bacillati bacterium]